MGFKELFSKIKDAEEFKKFKKDNPDAFLYAAFFVISDKIEQKQLDFYKGNGKVETFIFNEDEKGKEILTVKTEDAVKQADISPIDEKIKIDIDKIEEIAKNEAEKEGLAVNKIIAILQNNNGNQIWNLTVLLPNMYMLRMHIDMDGNVIERKKGTVFDIVQKKDNNPSVA